MIEQGIKPSSTTFSSLLMACSISGNLWHGKVTHGYIMRNVIEADIFINGSLVDLYFKCGSIVSAEFAFKGMPRTNVVAWNIMISGYVSVGCDFEALGVFSEMENAEVKPNAITFTSVLVACSRLAALEQGKELGIIAPIQAVGTSFVVCLSEERGTRPYLWKRQGKALR
ncbi:hypothetical protein RJ639_018395 [Escallonia herrerae]|uniref:Pentatricopeptide repeat-containing protein n=1 Tax=Escallonia herrerae TaxID=1293975 RepID=A0AA88VC00_9ASTE|nr:hypothetical protein RJ639_018395 [Escallonia herrerae]